APREAPPTRPRPAEADVAATSRPAPVEAAAAPVASPEPVIPDAPAAAPDVVALAPAPTPVADASRDQVEAAWVDAVLPRLGGLAKAMYSAGHIVATSGDEIVVAFPNEAHRQKCEQKRADVEQALSTHLGRPYRLRLVVDDARPDSAARSGRSSAPADLEPSYDDLGSDIHELEDAPAAPEGVDALTAAFPGAELINPDE
ncbi:MAG: polymerase subunit gamma/tau, partial [Acidimicrobiales bacterium]|nr:polymerase subunit gamma/tau [Acidimicrobiales bacterium]